MIPNFCLLGLELPAAGLPQHQMPLRGRDGLEEILPACFSKMSQIIDYFQAQTLIHAHNYNCVQVEPGKPGAEVSKKKTISQRKNLPIECAQGDQPLRCPNRVF